MTENIAWGAVILAGFTAVGTAYNTLQNRLAKRDQLQADVKFVKLESDLAACVEKHATSDSRLEHCQEEHKRAEDDRSHLWRHIERLQAYVGAPSSPHQIPPPSLPSA